MCFDCRIQYTSDEMTTSRNKYIIINNIMTNEISDKK